MKKTQFGVGVGKENSELPVTVTFLEGMLIKRSNLMQQYADIYLLQRYSTCFGCHSTHHQEH